jgi:cephalosporin hydroxylase
MVSFDLSGGAANPRHGVTRAEPVPTTTDGPIESPSDAGATEPPVATAPANAPTGLAQRARQSLPPGALLIFDEAAGEVILQHADGARTVHALDTPEAFEAVSAAWLRCGWDVKYVYGFTWLGRPIIQLPEDMVRIQELIWQLRPDVVVETGIAHGGSLVFYASLFAAMGKGRAIGVDIDIRKHNRAAIEAHPLAERITLIEGSSTDPTTVVAVRGAIRPDETVLVVLDSNHLRDHVAAELRLYSPLVSRNSFIVVCDGIMAQVAGAPRTRPDWSWNNPLSAIECFLAGNPDFVLEEPESPFNEGLARRRVTYWPHCWLRRRA